MNFSKSICSLGVVALAVLPHVGNSQGTVTDQFGTKILTDYAPPSVQSSGSGRNGGPLNFQRSGSRSQISQNSNYTGTNVGAPEAEEELLVNQLLGVVLVPSPGDVRPGGWPGVEGVWHDFKDFPPEVGWTLQNYLRKPVSLTSLDRMVKDVIVAYREGDRPVVDVLLPEQDITSGVVQLVVIESKLSRIRVEGVDVDTEEYIRSQMRVRKGEVIRSSEILHDLAWLNRSPYRKVDLAYAPGRDFGTTDVILKPYNSKMNSFFVGYEDSGTEFLGRERFVTGVNFGELGRPGRSLAYQFTSDFDFEHVRGNTVVYSHDLPWRHNLTLLASFVDVDATVPVAVGLPPARSEGFNWQLSARYNIPLKSKETYLCEPLFGTIQRRRDMHFGFDFKANENDLEFGGLLGVALGNTLNTQVEIYQFTAGYKEVWQHPGGVSQLDVAGFYSPGGFSPQNSDRVFNLARPGSEANYAYATAGFEHQHRLMQDWSMRTKLAGQIANGNLQASEQYGAGGYSTVRGFDQSAIRGDEGIYGTFELYAPEMSFARIFDWPYAHGPCTDSLRLLGFFDAASVSNVTPNPNVPEPNSQTIASVGVGMRYTYNDFFKLRVDYGHPVMSDVPVNAVNPLDTSGRFHIGATATF
ncbi:MAG: ShlB/FhaC/HecB family hemolysin secretion/activation protein [Verrucomicrobiales bacterium]|nr:ShlB/FhaC/HecB family hemolysin secretion/activation protein [Verrucomicrobiales bacterium]